jgi:hypothetical protein
MKTKLLWSLVAALVLAACGGGGGGGGGGTPPGNGGDGGTNPPSGGTSFIWEAQPYTEVKDAFLQQLNAQGARGFYYAGSQVFNINPNTGTGGEFAHTYVKGPHTYSYEILTTPSTSASFVTQANDQGSRGFELLGPVLAGFIYVKDNNSSATHSVELLDATTTAQAFLTQKNNQGTRGYAYTGDYGFGTAPLAIVAYSVFAKSSASNAVFEYALEPGDTTTIAGPDQLVAQANARGQQGFRYSGGNVFVGDAGADRFRNVYVKDGSQASATFSFATLDITNSSQAFVTQANAQGQAGALYIGGLAFPTADPLVFIAKSLYVTPLNCSGILCRAESPL